MSRSRISFTIRWPISSSVGVSPSSSRKPSAPATERRVNSWIERLADRDGEHGRLEARAVAVGAGPEAHVLLDPLPLLGRVGLAVAPLEVAQDALERHRVLALAAHPVLVLDEDPVAVRAVEEPALLLLGQLAPRQVGVDLVAVGDRLDHALVEARAADRPRHERAVGDRDRRVGHEHVRVDLELRAEARCSAGRRRAAR